MEAHVKRWKQDMEMRKENIQRKKTIPFPTVTIPFHIPTAGSKVSSFPSSSSTLVVCVCVFNGPYPNVSEVVSHCSFVLHFLND